MLFVVCVFWYLIVGRLFSRCSSILLIPCSSSSCICAYVGRQIIGSVSVVGLVSCCCGGGVWFIGLLLGFVVDLLVGRVVGLVFVHVFAVGVVGAVDDFVVAVVVA